MYDNELVVMAHTTRSEGFPCHMYINLIKGYDMQYKCLLFLRETLRQHVLVSYHNRGQSQQTVTSKREV